MSEEKKEIGTIEQAVADIRAGKLVLVIDDPDRENEGDLICAAEFATQENVNFMACHAKGLICMPMSAAMCEKLGLEQMVAVNTDNHSTAFTVSIDHVDTTTGISAYERSVTALKAVEDGAKPEDFRRPGHMFPLRAREGGVLKRTGHTEATVDLVKLAGLKECEEIQPGVFRYREGAEEERQALPQDARWPDTQEYGMVCYLLDVPANSEVHLCLPYLQRQGQHAWVSVYCGEGKKDFWVTDEDNIEGTGLSRTAWLNLGYFEEAGQITVFLEVPQGEPVSYGQVWAKAYDMAQYEEYALQRAQAVLQEVEVSDNHLTGKLTSETDTILCFSVPYSQGWQAMVDGQPVKSFRANGAFIGLEVPAGTHDVELYYITPGLKQGILLSGMGVISLTVLLIVYRKRKNGGRNGSLSANT